MCYNKYNDFYRVFGYKFEYGPPAQQKSKRRLDGD